MRVIVADRAVEFAADFQRLKNFGGTAQAAGENRQFLADRRRRSGLPVRTGQQRNGLPLFCFGGQIGNQRILRGGQHFAPLLQHQRMREVVNVFGGAGEM